MALADAVNTLQGLQALRINQANMANAEQQRKQQEQQAKTMQLGSDYLRKYQQSVQEGKPDYNSLNEAILVVPELADNVLKGIGIQDKSRMQRAADDYIALTGAIDNKDQFNLAAADRVNNVLENGGNPSDILALVKAYNEQGKDAAMQLMRPIGAALVNKGALKPELFEQPSASKEMDKFQMLEAQRAKIEAAQGPEAAARFATFAKLSSRPVSEVNVNMPQDKKIGELDAKAFTQYSENAKAARKELNSIAALKTLSERAVSGTGADLMLTGGKLLNQLGFEIEGLTESEVFQQLANTLVLDKSQQMSGALSNADMAFLTNTVPTLTNTKEGRRLSLDMAERLAKRQMEIQNLAVKFRRESRQNGDDFDDAEFQQYINQWAEENPLFKNLELPKTQAPKAAVDYLMQNPQFKQQFVEKYGYLPEGIE
jgi:hypothetical protein